MLVLCLYKYIKNPFRKSIVLYFLKAISGFTTEICLPASLYFLADQMRKKGQSHTSTDYQKNLLDNNFLKCYFLGGYIAR